MLCPFFDTKIRKGEQTMKLKLVKQGDFLGTKCDFYVDDENNVFMSRTQIGYALKYKDPANAIKNIHNKNHSRFDKYSVVLTGAQFEPPLRNNTSAEKVYMYNEFGIYAMCARSRQLVADDFNDWVANVISLIRKNGYYIASEKDNKWLGAREESKQARKYETDQIKLFVEYARQHGSGNADRYYMVFTKLVNGKLLLGNGQRDSLSQETLMEIKALETLVKMRIKTLMEKSVPYKKIYQEVKKMIEEI